ncbi:MAG TPA: DUF3179 domain-containing (seleno)protein, partial [Anaerolineales bacterium]|nr:DUF3179 domain-containing (seleno)protein [Anaerolineales bacterium]
LSSLNLSPDLELIVFTQGGKTRALVAREMAYHHIAQGELNGQPYMVSFCAPCNSGVGLTPVVKNTVHHFGAIGLTDGLAILADRETRTHWHHITGEALTGPLAGHQLEVWPVHMTTVAEALVKYPDLTISLSGYRSLQWRLAQRLYPRFIHNNVWLPGFFYASMSEPIDPRLDKLTQGLGVILGKRAKYYPLSRIPHDGIRDRWLGRTLYVKKENISGAPYARWQDTGQEPMQLLSRWYGFSFTYPQCEVYQRGDS